MTRVTVPVPSTSAHTVLSISNGSSKRRKVRLPEVLNTSKTLENLVSRLYCRKDGKKAASKSLEAVKW